MTIVYQVSVETETEPLEGNVLCSGDDVVDRNAELEVQRQLEDGNIWAWCTVYVKAYYTELPCLIGYASLGMCSYLSEDDFCNGLYFTSMKEEAKQNLDMKLAIARDLE